MPTWLNKQRKGDLMQLADRAGLRNYDSLLKDELVSALDKHLRANATSLSRDPVLGEFYERSGSPTKRERENSTAPPSEVQSTHTRKRITKVKDELDSLDEPGNSPASAARRSSSPYSLIRIPHVTDALPIPPSPSVVTDAIERQTALVRDKASDYWTHSSIPLFISSIRDTLSSPRAVEAVILTLEAWGLQRETLPWRYAFDIPAVAALGTSSHAVFVPDFFLLLSGFFWSATTVWAMTSVLVPLAFAYIFNLTTRTKVSHGGAVRRKRTHEFDPLTFNVVKALATWLVYSQGFRFGGLFANHTVARVEAAIPGGYHGMMVGAGVCVLSNFWEALLRK